MTGLLLSSAILGCQAATQGNEEGSTSAGSSDETDGGSDSAASTGASTSDDTTTSSSGDAGESSAEGSDSGPEVECLEHDALAEQMREALVQAELDGIIDLDTGSTIAAHPNVDLAVVVFQPDCPPAYANVLASRDRPDGHVAPIDPQSMQVQGVTWRGWSYARWDGDAPWDAPFGDDTRVGPASGDLDFMIPNPASTFKVVVGVGIALGIDMGVVSLDDPISVAADVPGGAFSGTVGEAMDRMLTASSNSATSALIRRLHDVDILPDLLRQKLDALGLYTLRLDGTQPNGDWIPPGVGDTTGWFHMTAWDTVRLLWLLDPRAPGPSWTADGVTIDPDLLSDSSRQYLHTVLEEQGWHEVLSTTATCGTPGREPGIPAVMPGRWLGDPDAGDFSVTVDGLRMSEDVRPCNDVATVSFAHKTGITNNFGSNAGIVTALDEGGRHYIIAMFANLGSRYTDAPLLELYDSPCDDANLCYTQRLAFLGRSIDEAIAAAVEP